MISEIINLLSDNDKSLVTSLLKTQVFASRLNNKELYQWVTKELNGFAFTDELPVYRIAAASVFGTMKQNGKFFPNRPLPVSIYGMEQAKELIRFSIYGGVGSMEKTASGKFGDYIIKPFSADFCKMLDQKAQETKHGDIILTEGRTQVHINEFTNSLSKIRAQFLDLILKVEQENPNVDESFKDGHLNKLQVNQTITQIMTQININSSGQGNIITTGDHNKITATINISKGNIDELREELARQKVNVDDIEEVTEIVQVEVVENNTFGPRLNGWMSKMLNKSIEGSWEVGVAVAGGILVEILKKYHGL